MALTQPRSGAARLGLLVVALLHLLATSALPYTHTHEPPDLAAGVSATPLESDTGSQPGHSDLCTICRTLVHAQLNPVFATLVALPADVVVLSGTAEDDVATPQHSTLSQPRAPPIA